MDALENDCLVASELGFAQAMSEEDAEIAALAAERDAWREDERATKSMIEGVF